MIHYRPFGSRLLARALKRNIFQLQQWKVEVFPADPETLNPFMQVLNGLGAVGELRRSQTSGPSPS